MMNISRSIYPSSDYVLITHFPNQPNMQQIVAPLAPCPEPLNLINPSNEPHQTVNERVTPSSNSRTVAKQKPKEAAESDLCFPPGSAKSKVE